MKLKGIWVAIAVICVAGIGITDYSARHLMAGDGTYVSENRADESVSGKAGMALPEQENGAEEATEAGTSGYMGAAGAERTSEMDSSIGNAEAGADVVQQKKTETAETEPVHAFAEQEITADTEGEPSLGSSGISIQADMPDESGPEAAGAGITMEKEDTQAGTKTGILAQLAELDAQAEERRSALADGSANALKAAAESERKIWENKMQSILETLEQQLSGDEKTAFFTEQRSWVRDRESTAVANSKKQSGSTLEELEYIRSLRDLTRDRVYALAKQYETILDGIE